MPSYGEFQEQARQRREKYFNQRAVDALRLDPSQSVEAENKVLSARIGEDTRAVGNPWAAYPAIQFGRSGSINKLPTATDIQTPHQAPYDGTALNHLIDQSASGVPLDQIDGLHPKPKRASTAALTALSNYYRS